MKKFALILSVIMLSSQAFAGTLGNYTRIGSNVVYSNTPMRYSIQQRARKVTNVSTKTLSNSEAQALGALLAGAGLATGRISLLNTPAITTPRSAMRTFLDPYIININNVNYVLVKDSKEDNWSVENILGYGDSKDDLFASLKNLESDGDISKISLKELKKANIRFVRLNQDESLALTDRTLDYDINKVQYIDMNNLRTALGNKNQDGTFGYFYVIVKDGSQKRAYPGRVTFEDKEELNKYIK